MKAASNLILLIALAITMPTAFGQCVNAQQATCYCQGQSVTYYACVPGGQGQDPPSAICCHGRLVPNCNSISGGCVQARPGIQEQLSRLASRTMIITTTCTGQHVAYQKPPGQPFEVKTAKTTAPLTQSEYR